MGNVKMDMAHQPPKQVIGILCSFSMALDQRGFIYLLRMLAPQNRLGGAVTKALDNHICSSNKVI